MSKIERPSSGENVTVTGTVAAKLAAVSPDKREFLTTEDLLAMGPQPGGFVPEFWEHELEGDTTDDPASTDDLEPI